MRSSENATVLSGCLLERWCPDPKIVATMPAEIAAHAYDKAHYIWYVFSAIGIGAFFALLLFRYLTDKIDAAKVVETRAEESSPSV